MNRWTFCGPWKCPDCSIYMTKGSSPEIGAPFLFSEFLKKCHKNFDVLTFDLSLALTSKIHI